MTRYALLAVATAGLAACTVGCQNSGHSHAEADYNDRPRMTSTYQRTDTSTAGTAGYSASASTDMSAYTTPVTLRRDASYMTSPSGSTSAGTLRSGDTVYLRSGTTLDSTNGNGYVAVKTNDNRVVYVRSDALQMR